MVRGGQWVTHVIFNTSNVIILTAMAVFANSSNGTRINSWRRSTYRVSYPIQNISFYGNFWFFNNFKFLFDSNRYYNIRYGSSKKKARGRCYLLNDVYLLCRYEKGSVKRLKFLAILPVQQTAMQSDLQSKSNHIDMTLIFIIQ
jgi:hypothetical protein